MNKINRVLIVGGTHGNELTGVYLIEKFERNPALIHRSNFATLTLLANAQAITAGVRYRDKDLNRCFDRQERTDKLYTDKLYEVQRAQEIVDRFGTQGKTPVDVILDLHSTTANMGLTLILDRVDAFNLQLIAYLSATQPQLKAFSFAGSERKRDALRSIAPHGICLEVGAIAHGTLQPRLFRDTEALVHRILDYLEQYNSSTQLPQSTTVTIYAYDSIVHYPRSSDGKIQAMIHPQLQFRDYEALHPGEPMFLDFDGETIVYTGDTVVYPIFINEAAYYEKDIAMYLTHRLEYSLYDSEHDGKRIKEQLS